MAMSRVLMRNFHSSAKRFSLLNPPNPAEYAGATKMWRNLTIFIAFPAIGLCMVNAYLGEQEHEAHFVRKEFIPYDHINRRCKKFPWGDGKHSLFFNPHVNTTEDGYDN